MNALGFFVGTNGWLRPGWHRQHLASQHVECAKCGAMHRRDPDCSVPLCANCLGAFHAGVAARNLGRGEMETRVLFDMFCEMEPAQFARGDQRERLTNKGDVISTPQLLSERARTVVNGGVFR